MKKIGIGLLALCLTLALLAGCSPAAGKLELPSGTEQSEPAASHEAGEPEREPSDGPEETESGETPEISRQDSVGEQPEVSEKPENSRKPEISRKPETSRRPETSRKPEPSGRPDESEQSEISRKPELSREPEPSAAPEKPKPPKPDMSGSLLSAAQTREYQQEVLRLVNIERTKTGVSPLTYAPGLQDMANTRAMEIIEKFSHTRPNGKGLAETMKEYGVVYYGCGENIASGHETPEIVMYGRGGEHDCWMKSDGHRENILRPEFEQMAVGVYRARVKGSSGKMTERCFWVQIFYTPFH